MNRPMRHLFVISCLVALGLASPSAQPAPPAAASIVKTLNTLLAAHCAHQPVLKLAGAGIVVRQDADGSTMTIDFGAIEAVDIDRDAEAHVLLKCRDAKPCIVRADGVKTSMPFVAFSIDPAERGDEVARLFKSLRASLAGSAKKQPLP